MPFRFSLKWLLAAVVYVAIAAAAFKQGWWIWADLLWGAAWLALAYALLNAWLREGSTRAGAAGFVILMGCYGLSVQFAPGSLPTERILRGVGVEEFIGIPPPPTVSYPTISDVQDNGLSIIPSADVFMARNLGVWEPKLRAAHSFAAMVAGLAGCWLALVAWRQAHKRQPPTAGGASLLVAIAVGMASGGAYGQDGPITYVDATDGPGGNTQLASGDEFVPRSDRPVGDDNRWSVRPFGNQGTVYTAGDGLPTGPEDAPQLVTTLSGLTPGERYNVFVYFWTDQHNWQIQATLEPPLVSEAELPETIPPKNRTAAAATPELFNSEVLVAEGNRRLMQAPLGRIAANDKGEIHVWVDDVPATSSANRTWYDGVGYTVAPKPAGAGIQIGMNWWPWIALLAVGFVIYIMIAARGRGRVSIVDEAPPT